jgi:hypothetical protein
LAKFLLLGPLVQQFGQVLILTANTLGNLNNDASTFQLNFLALVEVAPPPMHVSHEIATVIVDHDALVKGVILEAAILPSLLLSPEIVREEAQEFQNGSAVPAAARVQRPSNGRCGSNSRRHRQYAWHASVTVPLLFYFENSSCQRRPGIRS